jgi:hypothetical protein
MDFIKSSFDTSPTSMVLGLILLVALFFLVKYFLVEYQNMNERTIYMVSIVLSVIGTLTLLYFYTQFIKRQGLTAKLNEEF